MEVPRQHVLEEATEELEGLKVDMPPGAGGAVAKGPAQASIRQELEWAVALGLSYYSDASLMRRLKMDPLALPASRQQLVQAGLIAFEKPLYQVLSLEPAGAPRSGPIRVGELLRQALGGPL
jgi:hypothetical protein